MKTIEQIKSMKKVLLYELNQLPGENSSDETNDPDRERLHGWIIDLTYIEEFGAPGDHNNEVALWFNEENSGPLSDYEQSCKEFTEHERLLRYAAWLNM